MNIVVIGAGASAPAWPAISFSAADGAARLCQCADSVRAACAASGLRLRRAVNCWREALEHRLQEFVLELLAAIVLFAIFMIVTEPATREEC